jgi:hypothetical protein
MKNTFILYVFDVIRFYIFNNMFGQTLSSLILTKPRMQGKNGQRENLPRRVATSTTVHNVTYESATFHDVGLTTTRG